MQLFGELVKGLRSKLRLGLREFCQATGEDPSNWSKIERGLLAPPHGDTDRLTRIAQVLQLKEGSEERDNLFIYASTDAGRIPEDVMKDEELLAKLPVFFRTIRGQKPKREDLVRLAEALRSKR